ncbi:MAG: glycosyltransferase [Halioglobus sp.]|nr:glycosyltransferase [Halioglobus sp.]
MRAVDVVVPVYDGYAETVACLHTVLATVDFEWARIVVINDASPDPRITAWLRDLATTKPQVVLLENASNQGFVKTANRGMSEDIARDIVLLNSDVEVAGNWLHRLREAAYANAAVGSVTPFSNNATLCSFPNICKENAPLFGLSCAQIDEQFSALFSATDVIDLPTGVGFCLYIRRDSLDAVGLFDAETFGRGYGEENDWCQRAAAAGWRNVLLANCFVYHKGGVSFGEEQEVRIARAMELLDRRYPDYHRSIQNVIADDPAKVYRIPVAFALFARQQKPKVVVLCHKLGGGAQQHIDELVDQYTDQALFLQITPDEDGRSVRLEMFGQGERLQDGLYFDCDLEYDTVVSLLAELGVDRVHFHHTMGLHPKLWLLASDLGCDHDLTLHDYYLVNGNPTLTDANARYVHHTAQDFDARCAEHYPLPSGVSAATWRENQRLLVENAARLIFPSADCRQRFGRFFQVDNGCVAWHPDYYLSQPYPTPIWSYHCGRPLRVMVLGAISREKGADILERVALNLRDEAIEFHLLGYAYRALQSPLKTHGPYDNDDVYVRVGDIQPDVIWYPALWPETYSYTLSIALHLGLPVVVPDIGAFSERVRHRPHSVVQPWDNSMQQWCTFWRNVLDTAALPETRAAVQSIDTIPGDFYPTGYLSPVRPVASHLTAQMRNRIAGNYSVNLASLSRRERLLAWVWRLSRTALVARLVALVPFRMQRALKRRLSRKPMHDIVRNV